MLMILLGVAQIVILSVYSCTDAIATQNSHTRIVQMLSKTDITDKAGVYLHMAQQGVLLRWLFWTLISITS